MSEFRAVPAEFLQRARHEAERYGDDAWIMLRELVQNSRDAGATVVEINVVRDGPELVLSCRDNGCGMSRSDVERYLLRLYASNKAPSASENERSRADGAVGRFGVGFWSILLFRPLSIRLRTDDGSTGSGFTLDVENLALAEIAEPTRAHGTEVVLRRRATDDDTIEKIGARLRAYAGAVTGLAGREPPQLRFNGEPAGEPLVDKGARDSHFGFEAISGNSFDGVVGLGRTPSVRLYAHGLLIREATALDELLPRRAPRTVELPGLFPVLHINANGLDVLMNRQAVVEDALLARVVSECSKRVWRLQTKLLDKVAPISLLPRLRLLMARPGRLSLLITAAVLIVGIGSGAGLVLGQAFLPADSPVRVQVGAAIESALSSTSLAAKTRSSSRSASATNAGRNPRPRTVDDVRRVADGSVVNNLDRNTQLPSWAMQYDGPARVFFRGAVLEEYDPRLGFRSRKRTPLQRAPARPPRKSGAKISVELAAPPGDSPFPLPTPFGATVDARTVTVDGKAGNIALSNAGGLAVLLRKSRSPATVRFVTQAGENVRPLAPPALKLEWPPAWRRALKTAKRKRTVLGAAESIASFVRGRLRYTTSAEDAARFSASTAPWFNRTLELGIGDCDIFNGVTVLALWDLGIPARLVVGLVGDKGEIAPVLHAWTEVYDSRAKHWRFVDASPPRVVPTRGPSSGVPAALSSAGSTAELVATPPSAPDVETRSAAVRGEESNVDISTTAESSLTDPSSTTLRTKDDAPFTLSPPMRAAVVVSAAGVGLAGLLIFIFSLWSMRRQSRHDAEDPILDELVRHLVRHRGGPDPLRLRLRPFFPTLRRKKISLARAERAASRDALFYAIADNPWVNVVRGTILDGASSSVNTLVRTLASTNLAPLAQVEDLDAPPSDPHLLLVADRFRRVLPECRLRASDGTDGVREVRIRTARGERTFIFVDTKVMRQALDASATGRNRPTGAFEVASWVIERASVLHPHRIAILDELAAAQFKPTEAEAPRE